MTAYEIPLTANPQTVNVALGGATYNLRLIFNDSAAPCWLLDIADAGGNALVDGLPLVPGVDLLGPYAYLGFGGKLAVVNDLAADEPPGFDQLGVTAHLLWIPD